MMCGSFLRALISPVYISAEEEPIRQGILGGSGSCLAYEVYMYRTLMLYRTLLDLPLLIIATRETIGQGANTLGDLIVWST